jgi:hypothetical protein
MQWGQRSRSSRQRTVVSQQADVGPTDATAAVWCSYMLVRQRAISGALRMRNDWFTKGWLWGRQAVRRRTSTVFPVTRGSVRYMAPSQMQCIVCHLLLQCTVAAPACTPAKLCHEVSTATPASRTKAITMALLTKMLSAPDGKCCRLHGWNAAMSVPGPLLGLAAADAGLCDEEVDAGGWQAGRLVEVRAPLVALPVQDHARGCLVRPAVACNHETDWCQQSIWACLRAIEKHANSTLASSPSAGTILEEPSSAR